MSEVVAAFLLVSVSAKSPMLAQRVIFVLRPIITSDPLLYC